MKSGHRVMGGQSCVYCNTLLHGERGSIFQVVNALVLDLVWWCGGGVNDRKISRG
jgi:hypothetical protein